MIKKNIQVIDAALNCAYDVYRVSDEDFRLIFPKKGQNIEFGEDLAGRLSKSELEELFSRVWEEPIEKALVNGINGILFFQLKEEKGEFYPNKKDSDLDGKGRSWHHE